MSEYNKGKAKSYTAEYKTEAVKLVRAIGVNKAAMELGIAKSTVSTWARAAARGLIDTGAGTQTPQAAMTQAAEIQRLRTENKRLEKENRRLQEINEFLEEASAFFAASRQKLAKKNG